MSPLHTVEIRKATIGTLMNGKIRFLLFVAVNATIKKPGKEILCSQSEIVCFLILGWCPDFLVCSATRSCVAKDPV